MSNGILLVLAYLAFVSLGLPDAVIGVAWPSASRSFAVSPNLLGAPLAAQAATYFLSGMVAGRLIGRLGLGPLLFLSTTLVAGGVSLFAAAPSFGVFLAAGTVVGFGSGAIDSALNAYAAAHFGARHMSWLHAAYSLGAAIGPVVMTAVLARQVPWRWGYAGISAALFLLAAAFFLTRGRFEGGPAPARPAGSGHGEPAPRDGRHAWKHATVRLQVLVFFLYAGVEVGAGQWSYTVLTSGRGQSPVTAGTWVSLYWGSILAGRVALGFVVEDIGPVRLLRLATGGALLGALLFALPPWLPLQGALGLALLGFALAPIFPGLMGETPRRVGRDIADHAVGMQVAAATVGVASIPGLLGFMAARVGLEAVPWLVAALVVGLTVFHERLVALTPAPGTAS